MTDEKRISCEIKVTRRFTQAAAGSVLWEQGKTVVWCTASVSPDLPPWFKPDRAGGWLTAEYVMMPASTPQRKEWPKLGHTDSRGTEIQRLIGRSLRAIVDLSKIGPFTIAVDCQVLQADGGTRTAAICGAYVALIDAARKMATKGVPAGKPINGVFDPVGAIRDQLAAVSVGIVDGEVRLDLDYIDDSRAEVDLNAAYTGKGKFVEVQGSAENGEGFDRTRMNEMLDMAVKGCGELMQIQRKALEA